MELTVECQKRPEGMKPKALRRSGVIPCNLYGHQGTESMAIAIDTKTVETLLRKASVNNTLINLKVANGAWQGKTLLREVQSHPAKGNTYHLSFFAVAGHGDTTVEVPLNFLGDAVGVKEEGGILDTVITQLQVSCKPESIPEAIEIDVSNMKVGDSLHIHELALPEGVTVLDDEERMVVSILPPPTLATTEETPTETDGLAPEAKTGSAETESESAAS